MNFLIYISEKINPLQSIIVLSASVLISSFFAVSGRKAFKKFIIVITFISLISAFYLNIYSFISAGNFSSSLLTFGTLQVIEVSMILFSTLNLLLFIAIYEIDCNHFIKILMLLLFSAICAIFVVVAGNFILFFTSLTLFVLTIFQLAASLNLNISKSRPHILGYFLRPVLTVILFFFGFSLFYGAAEFKSMEQILNSESISNPLIALGLIIFGIAMYLYFFLFPFQNPYLGMVKRSRFSSNAVIWFLYFPVGFFIFLKFGDLYNYYIGKSSIYMSITFMVIAFVCMLAGNIGAITTGSIRRILSFLFLFFTGIFLLNLSMFSAGIISSVSTKWINMANILLIMLSFIPISSVFNEVEKNTGSDSINGLAGFGRSNIFIVINLIILFLSWLMPALYILPLMRSRMVSSGAVALNIILMAIIAIVIIFLTVNIFRVIIQFFKRSPGGTVQKIRFPRFFYIYITFFTLIILAVSVLCLLEISGISTGTGSFKITDFNL